MDLQLADAPARRSMTAREKKLVALYCSTTLALLLGCAFLFISAQRAPLSINTQAALKDPALRDEIVRQLSSATMGIFDSHNDPAVGRILQPNLTDAKATGVLTRTNSFGLRERHFKVPKPAGTLRVVLLGDSFIHGFGVEAQERVGAYLERYLRKHATGWDGPIECLHVGVGGWNVVAECTYLRRTLSQIAPDLVIHVLISNDLDDHAGTRGFGALASFAPLERHHADALVFHSFPVQFTSPFNTNYLLQGSDWESRHRYQQLADEIGRLVPLIRQSGARYLAVSHWANLSPRLWRHLSEVIEREEFIVLPPHLQKDRELILSETDTHWSEKGHEFVAKLLFGEIRKKDLLPQLALSPWPETEEFARVELANAWQETMVALPRWYWAAPYQAVASLEPARFTELEWRQVYTGLDDQGQVSPFASFHLARREERTLRLRGRALPRPELAGARIAVSVEGIPVGEHELVPGEAFDVRFPLPEKIKRRRGVNVRLETSDYGYTGQYLQHCISFVLERLALE